MDQLASIMVAANDFSRLYLFARSSFITIIDLNLMKCLIFTAILHEMT